MAIVTPPERLLHAMGRGVRGVWSDYVDLIHVRQHNQQLQQQIGQLRLEEASLAQDAQQALRLQKLLGFQEKYIYKTTAAQVIGTAGTEQSRVLLIDKGSDDGIRPDMAVITPDGIVGKTRDVFGHTSQVLEISDPTSGAGVMLEATRIQGVLRGDPWGQPEIVNVSPDERIKPGATVVTSGGDGIFPRGLPVGVVRRVVGNQDGTVVNVLVKPAVNLSALEEVLIITQTGDKMPAQMQQDLSQAQETAAQVLAARLPTWNAPAPANGKPGQAASQGPAQPEMKLPALPPTPPQAIHADRYSPMATPPAEQMVPGQVTPMAANTPAVDMSGAGSPGAGTASAAPAAARAGSVGQAKAARRKTGAQAGKAATSGKQAVHAAEKHGAEKHGSGAGSTPKAGPTSGGTGGETGGGTD
jgi:rod shape-determining protein MreC